jgi:hypothetical protein
MKDLLAVVRYIALFLSAGYIATFTPMVITTWYKQFVYAGGGFDIDLTAAAIYFDAVLVVFAFLTILLGRNILHAIHVRVILTLTVIIGVLWDPTHFYLPATVILIGAALGWIARIGVSNTLGKMTALDPYRKYF